MRLTNGGVGGGSTDERGEMKGPKRLGHLAIPAEWVREGDVAEFNVPLDVGKLL